MESSNFVNNINGDLQMLYVDKVINLEKGLFGTFVKLFTFNENFMQGHFEGNPVVPGTILIECMLQSIKVVIFSVHEFPTDILKNHKISLVNFKKRVIPGDELTIEVIVEGDTIDVCCFVDSYQVCNLKTKLK
jgi:3-hydroxyacyl-[acyl-carrier-protein] dehydratase